MTGRTVFYTVAAVFLVTAGAKSMQTYKQPEQPDVYPLTFDMQAPPVDAAMPRESLDMRDTTGRDSVWRDSTYRDTTRGDSTDRAKPKPKPKLKPKPKPLKPTPSHPH